MNRKSILLSLLIVSLCSCNSSIYDSVYTHIVDGYFNGDDYVFPMNTITTLRMYNQDQLAEVKPGFDSLIKSLSKEVDRYYDYEDINNLKTINDSCGSNNEITISEELFELIQLGIDLTKLTQGKFNLAMGEIIDLYSPLLDEEKITYNELPSQQLIDDCLSSIPNYVDIESVIVLNEENNSIILNQYNGNNVTISLGAIAKGYIMQKAHEYLKSYNYPALYDAGSSTMGSIGYNPMNKTANWTIGLSNPMLNETQTDYLATFQFTNDYFLSSSGDYQKNFIYQDENGTEKLMHHIIDPSTGISNDFIRSVTITSSSCSLAVLDALSTALFNVNSDEEFKELLDLFEIEYNCSISYLYTKQVQEGNFKDLDVYVDESFNKMITSKFANNVKNIKVI